MGVQGASYYTGSFSTVSRNPDTGEYIGLSSRGNFYMSWAPGQAYWQPHNRSSARRIQSMGWRKDGGVWQLTRGGGIYLSDTKALPEQDDEFTEGKIGSRGSVYWISGRTRAGRSTSPSAEAGPCFPRTIKERRGKEIAGPIKSPGTCTKWCSRKMMSGLFLGTMVFC